MNAYLDKSYAKEPMGVYAMNFFGQGAGETCHTWERITQTEVETIAKNAGQQSPDLWIPGTLSYVERHTSGSVAPPEPSDLNGVVITLDKSACFGTCPDYSVTIYGNGKLDYEGRGYTTIIGKKTYQMPASQVKELVHQFYTHHFFSLYDRYSLDITDASSVTTSISVNGIQKKVYCYATCPPEATAVNKNIEKAISQIIPGINVTD